MIFVDIFKKWWFYVIVLAVAVSLPFAIKTALTDDADGQPAAQTSAETSPPETVPPETTPPETVPPETVPPETTPPETIPPETVPPETVPPETVPPETMPPETAPPETTPPETTPPETTPPETTPPETTPPETAPPDGQSTTVTYVLNTNTMKFHFPTCSSVKDIKAKNRLDSSLTREEIVAQGYVPCKRCNP